jgi:hypothetical protein
MPMAKVKAKAVFPCPKDGKIQSQMAAKKEGTKVELKNKKRFGIGNLKGKY